LRQATTVYFEILVDSVFMIPPHSTLPVRCISNSIFTETKNKSRILYFCL